MDQLISNKQNKNFHFYSSNLKMGLHVKVFNADADLTVSQHF